MNLYQQANKVQNAGSNNSFSDKILAHITPEEAAILKMLGGSGRIDPVTGLPHFDVGNAEGGADGNGYGGGDEGGSESGGGGWGSGRTSDTGTSNDRSHDVGSSSGNRENDVSPNMRSYGAVDPNAVDAGTAYGIDAGDRVHGWKAFKTGMTIGAPAGLAGKIAGGLAGLAVGSAGSPAANGGGWGTNGNNNNGSKESAKGDGSWGVNYSSGWGGNVMASSTPATTPATTTTTSTPTTTAVPLNAAQSNLWGNTSTVMPTTNQVSNTTDSSSSLFPDIYTDPVTGRILSNSTNEWQSNQQLLDQIMGTHLAETNGVAMANPSSNPLLQQINSGLAERVGNDTIDNTVANTMKANDNLMARRGMGMLASPLQDQVRSSLGLSTAQARNANRLAAQDADWKKQGDLLSFLKSGQTADTASALGLADLENQRKIAEITAAQQEKLANQNFSYLQGVQNDNNNNAWISTAGNLLGSIDWGSLF